MTSNLPQTLNRYLEHQKQAAQLKHQLSSMALYPALLLGAGGIVLGFLSFFVVPRFARIFQGMQGDLPWTARAMLAWAHTLERHGTLVTLLSALIVATLLAACIHKPSRQHVLQKLTSHPKLAQRLETYHLSRWYRTIAMLLHGGIAFPKALSMAQQVLPIHMAPRARAVALAVNDGLSPVQALLVARMATPVAEQLARAGEQGGNLAEMLDKASQFHEVELTRWLERTMRILEPLVMAAMGLGIGGVVILMYLPIFELASAVQ